MAKVTPSKGFKVGMQTAAETKGIWCLARKFGSLTGNFHLKKKKNLKKKKIKKQTNK